MIGRDAASYPNLQTLPCIRMVGHSNVGLVF